MNEPARAMLPDVDVPPVGRAGHRVVQPISRAATRRCSRPGCPSPATATLAFSFDQRQAWLTALVEDGGPETYDLCREHAGRTRPPHAWDLHDDRPDDVIDTPDPDDLASERTVALLAAALHGPDDPEGTQEDGVVDTRALDAIADETDAVLASRDLYGTVDEADPGPGTGHDWEHGVPDAALDELSALSLPTEQSTARTVPGARRPD